MITTTFANGISKSITVRRDVEAAFRLWTTHIAAWWPSGHSLSGHPQPEIVMEGKVGGRFFERTPDGKEYIWGEVTVWDPPRHLAYHWYLGSSADLPTRVDIRFIDQSRGVTRIDVEHQGPNLIGDLWGQRAARYDSAWDHVLDSYAVHLLGS